MLIVGVDPGDHCGVAFYAPGCAPQILSVKGRDIPAILGVIQSVELAAKDYGGAEIVIERQFGAIRKNKQGGQSINLKALEALYRRRHEWEILAELYGIRTLSVYPVVWQSKMLAIAPKFGAGGQKLTTKARSLYAVAKLWPNVEGWTEDRADAALIARWRYVERMQLGELF